jgi:hypothetical protein
VRRAAAILIWLFDEPNGISKATGLGVEIRDIELYAVMPAFHPINSASPLSPDLPKATCLQQQLTQAAILIGVMAVSRADAAAQ